MSSEEKALHQEARKGMTNDEVEFSVESLIDNQIYLWSDKYRPRKPRYFNRVHTGFEWNKYNQTHYDMDNPPPKIVQGYKFNIFYPDLIDKSSTPEYFLVSITIFLTIPHSIFTSFMYINNNCLSRLHVQTTGILQFSVSMQDLLMKI